MKPEAIPDHLGVWWDRQYKAVQEFGQVLLKEDSASPRLMEFFETLARHCPKLRSVRMTNALHALWRCAPGSLVFELALKHCKTPAEINELAAQVERAMPLDADGARFDAEFTLATPFDEVLRWLERHGKGQNGK